MESYMVKILTAKLLERLIVYICGIIRFTLVNLSEIMIEYNSPKLYFWKTYNLYYLHVKKTNQQW